jgi:hypothetical protein
MTNAPETRKTHVVRILGTNKNGDILQDMWVDVERIDVAKNVTQTVDSPNYQGYERRFRWMDDPFADNFEEDGNPARKTVIVKVCDHTAGNVDDPEEWVPIPVIKSLKAMNDDQGTQDRLRDDPEADPETSRVIEVRRIVHYDTNIDVAAQTAFDANPMLKQYVVPGSEYTRDESTKSDSEYVEHEIITYLKHRTNETDREADGAGGVNRGRQTKLLNQYLIDESEPPTNAVIGASGINPPYRLDPYQNIVNVKFKSLYLVMYVTGANQSFSTFSPAPSVGSNSVSSNVVPGKGAKLMDSLPTPNSNNNFSTSLNCFSYSSGYGSVQDAWAAAFGEPWPGPGPRPGGFTEFAATNGACPWPGGGSPPEGTVVAPVNFSAGNEISNVYLYKIPAGDGLVNTHVGGIIAPFDSENIATGSSVSSGGSGSIFAQVYSTVKIPIKKLIDLVDLFSDGNPRPTQDDSCTLNITSSNQGDFLINVKQDKNVANAQIDNYGNTFQPFKVTFEPSSGSVDSIPSQPPPRLP